MTKPTKFELDRTTGLSVADDELLADLCRAAELLGTPTVGQASRTVKFKFRRQMSENETEGVA